VVSLEARRDSERLVELSRGLNPLSFEELRAREAAEGRSTILNRLCGFLRSRGFF
jgi:hypothetical protein